MEKNKKIVVIGSINTDMVVKTERLPAPGETVLGGTFFINNGGKGANQAVAAARMGGDVTFIAKTGNDDFGKRAFKYLEKEKIDTKYIFTDANYATGTAFITVDSKGENCIVVASGANSALGVMDIQNALPAIEQADIVLMQLETKVETVEFASKISQKNGAKVILNPAPATTIPDEIFKRLYAIIPNQTEAELLTGIQISDFETAKMAANLLYAKGVQHVIITLGDKGVLLKWYDRFYEVESVKTTVVDTTAAGDTFCGALCVALSKNDNLLEAVKFANRAAAISVSRHGAQDSIPYEWEM